MRGVRSSLFALCSWACSLPQPGTAPVASPATTPPELKAESADSASGGGADGAQATALVETPPTSAEECSRQCAGEFGPHGLAQAVYCLCRTADKGRDCRDAADCAGQCILEPIRREVSEPGPPERGYFVGRCSEFVKTFGCFRMLARGQRQMGAVALDEPPPEICLD